MSDNKIYEIAQMMGDNKALQNDLQEAASSALALFQDRYINKIYDTVKAHHLSVSASPSREVTLINALKPYVAEEVRPNMDKMINVITLMNTMQTMNKELAMYSNANSARPTNNRGFRSMSSSLHDDGVYDVDTNCMANTRQGSGLDSTANLTSILLMMALISSNL